MFSVKIFTLNWLNSLTIELFLVTIMQGVQFLDTQCKVTAAELI